MPQATYKKTFIMSGGEEPYLSLGKKYEIVCATEINGKVEIIIIDDTGSHHYFLVEGTLGEGNFSDYFDIEGDLEEVWETM